MNSPNVCLAALSALFFLPSCVNESETPDLTVIVETHLEESEADFRDCGVHSSTIQCSEAELPSELACLAEAWTVCEPARLRVESYTVEGDLIVEVLLVAPAGDGCAVTQFLDNSRDEFGGMDRGITQSHCARLSVDSSNPCQVPVTEDCETVQRWESSSSDLH